MEVDSQSSDNDDSSQKLSRLGKCEVCAKVESKYCCPKCEVKTCGLDCLKIHKKELACDGMRDRTKFIPLKNMTQMDMLSDYTFLEECTRYVNDRKYDKIKRFTRYNKRLATAQFRMRCAAQKHNIGLRFLLENFSRSKINTSYLEMKTNTIFWRVEWIFPNAGNLKFVDEQCSELEKLSDLLGKYFNPSSLIMKPLEFYHSHGIGNIRVLLKAEGIKRCNNRFYELNCKKTLRDNLRGKTIVEFPVIYLVFSDTQENAYDVIDSDEDVETETQQYQQSLDAVYGKRKIEELKQTTEEIQSHMENLDIRKKREDRQKRRAESEKEPKNLLFMDESLWNDLSSDTDSGDVTEEDEKPNLSSKKIKMKK